MSTPINATDATFSDTIPAAGIAVVDFWAEWCGPCRHFAPIFVASAAKHPDIVHIKVDIDTNRELAARFEIQAIPTTAFIRDGIVVGRMAGALTATRLEDLLTQTANLDMDDVRKRSGR